MKQAKILTAILIVALVVYSAAALTATGRQLQTARSILTELTREKEALEQENRELQYAIDHAGSVETIMEIARSRLGLEMPGTPLEQVSYNNRGEKEE